MPVEKSSVYNKNYLTTLDIFDLEADELSLFLRKKKDAPVGNLREIYHSQSNRGLISKIAKEMLIMILWEVIEGKTFYLPGSTTEKIFVAAMIDSRANFKRSHGKYEDMNLFMTDFKIPEIQLYIANNKRFHNTSLFVNSDLQERMVELVNTTGKVGGKIPFRLRHILPHLYNTFSYIERDCIKLICDTFFRRLKIIAKHGCDLVVKDRHNFIRFFYPLTSERYEFTSYFTKEFVSIKLRQDKIKKFPCQNKHQMGLTS